MEASDGELLGQVAAYYHGVLRESADARGYLAERGVGDEEAIAHFELGFADRTLGLRLKARTRKAGAELRGQLERLGVYRESGHEHLTGCVVFPIRDAGGSVVNLYGRRIGKVSRGAPSHLYLPGPRRGLWNREAFGGEELVLCESVIDALTFWCAGFRHVTAAWGVNGFTEEHGEAIAAGGVKRVLIAYDRDEAGERGARELAERLGGQGIGCFRVAFPRGMDANEYALKVRPAAESLGLALRSAEWMAGPTRRVMVAASTSAPASSAGAASKARAPATAAAWSASSSTCWPATSLR